MVEVSQKTIDVITGYVRQDLRPSLGSVLGRVGLALAVGGILSLFFCGQFGIGFSALAKGWNHAIHAHMGAIPCAIACGVLFSIAPVLVLRMISTGVLFRQIIRHYALLQASLILVAGGIMYFGGSFMNDLIHISVWALSAFLGFRLLGLLIDEMPRLRSSSPEA